MNTPALKDEYCVKPVLKLFFFFFEPEHLLCDSILIGSA